MLMADPAEDQLIQQANAIAAQFIGFLLALPFAEL